MKSIARLGVYLTDIFFPPRCVACARAGFVFCDRCAQAVAPVVAPICPHCGRPQLRPLDLCSNCRSGGREALDLVRVATLYSHPLRPAIHALKYSGQPELAAPLARYFVAVAQQPPWLEILAQIDGVIPVPLHAQRLTERGYNQSALLAGAFAERMRLKLAESWLSRARQTRSQVGLNAAERQQNVADAFHADSVVAGKRLLLIDDVFTTGATLAACAQALRQAGAAAVYGLVLSTPAPAIDDDTPGDV
ncbi:MAG: ComF family protein [Chloroflexi bacterium]|nr:ComF family protein [Chloroflexota bacterium]